MQDSADLTHIMIHPWCARRPESAPVRSDLIRVILLSLVFLVTQSHHLAAQTTSIIQGTVIDQQHLAIEGAAVKIKSAVLTSEIEITTDAGGTYRIAGLQPGTYSVEMAKPGFAAKFYEGLAVTVNRLLILDVVLEVGKVQEVMTVIWQHYPATTDRADADQWSELPRPHATSSRSYSQSTGRHRYGSRGTRRRRTRRECRIPN